jgi:hypothetical protein
MSWQRLAVVSQAVSVCLLLITSAAAREASTSPSVTTTPIVDEQVGVAEIHARLASHNIFERLTIKLPHGLTVTSRQDSDVVKLTFSSAVHVDNALNSGKYLVGLSGHGDNLTVQLAAALRVRIWHIKDLLVVDVFGPLAQAPVLALQPVMAPSIADSSRGPLRQGELQPRSTGQNSNWTLVVSKGPTKGNSLAPTPPANSKSAPIAATGAIDGLGTVKVGSEPIANRPGMYLGAPVVPPPISIVPLRDADATAPAILVPFSANVGAAAFSRGGQGEIVFDSVQTFDLSALKDDVHFGDLTEQLLPDGMRLMLRVDAASELSLRRRDDGWIVSLQPKGRSDQRAPITGKEKGGLITFDAILPGRVLVVNDDITGSRLLVGTQRYHGQHVSAAHASMEASLVPTSQGIVIQPNSDRVLLRTTRTGFDLSLIGTPALAMTWSSRQVGAWPDGRAMTRLFDFPDLPVGALHRLLVQALRDTAAAPKLARYPARMRVARAMLAEGLDVEALSVLRVAEADDPGRKDAGSAAELGAVAAWLSASAGGAAPPELPFEVAVLGDSDEAAFWKALLRPDASGATGQAGALAATWPLLITYPSALRHSVLAPVGESLLKGGEIRALSAMLNAFPDPSLDLVRADLLHSQGKIDESLQVLARVAERPDRLARANALERSVLIRLSAGRMQPASAAEALDRQIYAWRDGERELRLRQPVAKLRAQAGLWRGALAMLGETEIEFPQAKAEIYATKAAIVAELLKGDSIAKLSALDLVAIADAASDVLDSNDASFAPVLVDKLLALDLADRADPVLRRLFKDAKNNKTKAELGVRLAELTVDAGDASGALATLAMSDDVDVGASLQARRMLLRARLLERTGKPENALALLANQQSRAASELATSIMEAQHAWASAVTRLQSSMTNGDFSARSEADQQSLILRLARDEAEAGDQAGLHILHETQAARFAASSSASLFAVLTAEPVRSTADLPRSAGEVRTLQALPPSIAKHASF